METYELRLVAKIQDVWPRCCDHLPFTKTFANKEDAKKFHDQCRQVMLLPESVRNQWFEDHWLHAKVLEIIRYKGMFRVVMIDELIEV